MSNLPGNQFAEDHDEMYHKIGDTVVSEEGQTDATLIWSAIENHATATLALAYEQRLATLATMFNLTDGSAIPGVDYAEAARQLSEGLGMRAEK